MSLRSETPAVFHRTENALDQLGLTKVAVEAVKLDSQKLKPSKPSRADCSGCVASNRCISISANAGLFTRKVGVLGNLIQHWARVLSAVGPMTSALRSEAGPLVLAFNASTYCSFVSPA